MNNIFNELIFKADVLCLNEEALRISKNLDKKSQ